MIQATSLGILFTIGAMALVTLLTRIGSLPLMALIPFGPKTQLFIKYMAGSVLVAILVPLAVQGDLAARIALAVTAFLMLLLKKPLLAIGLGILAAALTRHFL